MSCGNQPAVSGRAPRTYVISSWVFGRALGVTLLIAFASIGVQARGLFGADGIAPIASMIASSQRAGHSVLDHPTLLWFGSGDAAITAVWISGIVASVALTIGVVPRLAALYCWVAYLSFVSVGWPFMSFQWDVLLLEATFLAVFLTPWTLWDRWSTHPDPNKLARWALLFLLFRLMFRSAWVKLASGDAAWADLTALSYHYWTQPLPTSLAWYADRLPAWFQKLSCLLMFVIEFGASFLLLVPRAWPRRLGALAIAFLMVLIAATGNYGFFNLLTVLLCLMALDDAFLRPLVPRRFLPSPPPAEDETWRGPAAIGPAILIALAVVVFFSGTFGPRYPSALRAVYPFSTVNNYGLFAVMTTRRPEIIIEGSIDGEHWKPYRFKYKPGPLDEPPRWVAPHQPRLDWQMWFAAASDFRRNPWLASFMQKLLADEPAVLALLADNPFQESPPHQVRAVVYPYEFTSREERRATGNWWKRGEPRQYAPILSARPPAADDRDSTSTER